MATVPAAFVLPPEDAGGGDGEAVPFAGTVSGSYAASTRLKWGWDAEYLGAAPDGITGRRWSQRDTLSNYESHYLRYVDSNLNDLADQLFRGDGTLSYSTTSTCPPHNTGGLAGITGSGSGTCSAVGTVEDYPAGTGFASTTYASTATLGAFASNEPALEFLFTWDPLYPTGISRPYGSDIVVPVGVATDVNLPLGAGWSHTFPPTYTSGPGLPDEFTTGEQTSFDRVTLSNEVTMRRVYDYGLASFFAGAWEDISSAGTPYAALVDNRGSDPIGTSLKMAKARYRVTGTVTSADVRRTFIARWTEVTATCDYSTLVQTGTRTVVGRDEAVVLEAGETALQTIERRLDFPSGLTTDTAPQRSTVIRGPVIDPEFLAVFDEEDLCPPAYVVRMTLPEAATVEMVGTHTVRWQEVRVDLVTGQTSRTSKMSTVTISLGETEFDTEEFEIALEAGAISRPLNFSCDTAFFYAAPQWVQA